MTLWSRVTHRAAACFNETPRQRRFGRDAPESGRIMLTLSSSAGDPKRTRQMIRLADGVVFDYVVPIFNMVTSTAKDSNGA